MTKNGCYTVLGAAATEDISASMASPAALPDDRMLKFLFYISDRLNLICICVWMTVVIKPLYHHRQTTLCVRGLI